MFLFIYLYWFSDEVPYSMDFCVISFVCLSVQMSVHSQDAALALAPGQQPWDSHSGLTLIQALALTQALTLTALF